ncbi:MAG: hypothetical protein HQM10_15860 [Candidatus Riflebacteria bacterium]|nr:hypothetical protein [Candidatus Riflebacteria bacterium]
MSSAIVTYPIIFTWAESAGAASAATGASASAATGQAALVAGGNLLFSAGMIVGGAVAIAVMPIVISAVLDSMTSSIIMEKPSEECMNKIKASTEKVRTDLKNTLTVFTDHLKTAKILSKSRNVLEKRIAEASELLENTTSKIFMLSLSEKDITEVKASLKSLTEEIASAEQNYLEMQKLFEHYQKKISDGLETLLIDNASSDSARRISETLDEIIKSSDDIETRLSAAADLCIEIAALKEKSKIEKAKNQIILIREEIKFYSQRLEIYEFDENKKSEIKKLYEKALKNESYDILQAIRDDIKISLHERQQSEKLSEFFKSQLKAFLEVDYVATAMKKSIESAIAADILSRERYEKIYSDVTECINLKIKLQKERIIREKISQELAKLNYASVEPPEPDIAETLASGKIAVLNTRERQYKLLVKLNSDQSVSIRLVRVVENISEKSDVSELQRQKENEIKEKWCNTADTFIQNLRNHGIFFIERVRFEDGIDSITIEQLEQMTKTHIETRQEKKTQYSARELKK